MGEIKTVIRLARAILEILEQRYGLGHNLCQNGSARETVLGELLPRPESKLRAAAENDWRAFFQIGPPAQRDDMVCIKLVHGFGVLQDAASSGRLLAKNHGSFQSSGVYLCIDQIPDKPFRFLTLESTARYPASLPVEEIARMIHLSTVDAVAAAQSNMGPGVRVFGNHASLASTLPASLEVQFQELDPETLDIAGRILDRLRAKFQVEAKPVASQPQTWRLAPGGSANPRALGFSNAGAQIRFRRRVGVEDALYLDLQVDFATLLDPNVAERLLELNHLGFEGTSCFSSLRPAGGGSPGDLFLEATHRFPMNMPCEDVACVLDQVLLDMASTLAIEPRGSLREGLHFRAPACSVQEAGPAKQATAPPTPGQDSTDASVGAPAASLQAPVLTWSENATPQAVVPSPPSGLPPAPPPSIIPHSWAGEESPEAPPANGDHPPLIAVNESGPVNFGTLMALILLLALLGLTAVGMTFGVGGVRWEVLLSGPRNPEPAQPIPLPATTEAPVALAESSPPDAPTEPAADPPLAATPDTAMDRPQAEARIRDKIRQWKQAWESGNINSYMSLYSQDFKSLDKGMDYWSYRSYKGSLFRQNSYINVELGAPQMTWDGTTVRVRFHQVYRSSSYSDSGTKILSFRLQNGDWTIYREDFQAD